MNISHTVYLGLGANVGDKKKNIQRAIDSLSKKLADVRVAPIYETKPWGYTKQGNFLNTVVCGITSLSPIELLHFVKAIEKEIGRIKRFRFGPREIDIDILFYDDLIVDEPDLKIPHPTIPERDFVLKPLMDLAPDFIHPIFKKTVKEIYGELPEDSYTIIRIREKAFR